MLPSLNKLDFSYFSIIYSSGSHVFELWYEWETTWMSFKGAKRLYKHWNYWLLLCQWVCYLCTINHRRYIPRDNGTCRSPVCLYRRPSGDNGCCFFHIHQSLTWKKEDNTAINIVSSQLAVFIMLPFPGNLKSYNRQVAKCIKPWIKLSEITREFLDEINNIIHIFLHQVAS